MKCVVCGREVKRSCYSNAILCSSECYHTNYWDEQVKNKDNPNIVRIDGVQYTIDGIAGEVCLDSFDNIDSLTDKDLAILHNSATYGGYEGKRFKIKLDNGTIIDNCILWGNGLIPESFRSLLPDNAKFIK